MRRHKQLRLFGTCRSRRFHPKGSRLSKKEVGVSAPYSGGLLVTALQNARSGTRSRHRPGTAHPA